jgi:hypothetical protein
VHIDFGEKLGLGLVVHKLLDDLFPSYPLLLDEQLMNLHQMPYLSLMYFLILKPFQVLLSLLVVVLGFAHMLVD